MKTVGLELGGTWIRAVQLSESGVIGERRREPTPSEPGEAGALLASFWKDLGGGPVALAAAPEIDDLGVVRRWPSRPDFVGSEILATLAAAGASPTVLDDASSAALAEHLSATEDSCTPSSTGFISVGTGLGGGAVLADRSWTGASGKAMDLGHVPVPSAGQRRCGCGRSGCLQTVVSGRFLEQQARRSDLPPDAVLESADAGDERARALLFSMVEPLLEAITILVRLIEPERIILGGGLMQSGPLFSEVASRGRAAGLAATISRGRWQTWAGALGAAVTAVRRGGQRLARIRETSTSPAYRLALVQGPNLNLLGEREPHHYGTSSPEQIADRLTRIAEQLGCHLYCVQSNHEGALVDWLQARRHRLDGAVVNPAALTAHGYSLRDALTGSEIPFVEVHLSNIFAREGWHRESCFEDVALGRVSGMREVGYEMALRGLVRHLEKRDAGVAEGSLRPV